MSKKNTAATIATIIVAVLAIATTLFLLYQTSQQQIQDNQYNYVPSDEINEEMNMNAVTLIKNNCEVFRIFLQYGLPHQAEPYNNVPEDGYYTVKSDNYKTISDIETLVNSTFVEKEAKRIRLDVSMVDENGRFKAINYDYTWSNAKFTLHPKSNTECDIIVELNPAEETSSAENASSGSDDSNTKKVTANMLKVNGEWRLQKLVY